MIWVLSFVVALGFYWGLWSVLDRIFDKAEAVRAEKRAKEHFKETERFRRNIG